MAQPDGFDEFVALRGADLRRLAFLLTSDRREAEELVESTLARCLAGWRRLEQEQEPFEYARGVLFQHGAPRRRRLATALADALAHRAGNRIEAAGGPTSHSDERDAGELTGDEDREELLCGLPGLRGIERKVVVLRLVEGLSEPQTATVLRRSPAAVRRHGDAAVRRIREAAAGVGTGPPDRAARARRRLRARHHYEAAATVVAVALAAITAAALTRGRPSSTSIAGGATPGVRASQTAGSTAAWSLPPRANLAAVPQGRHVVRMRTVHGARQLWLYDAATLAPLRALLPPDDARTQTGVTAVDPDGDDRVVFVRRLTIDVAATDGPAQPPLIAWRLDELSLATHQSGVLSPPRLGPGPDHLFFSAQGHRLAVVTDVDVEVLDTFDDGVAPVTLAIPPHSTVLGFLAADGPLLMSRLDPSAPGPRSSVRQTVVAVDTEEKAPDTVVYDSLVAGCNPTQQLWVPPTGVLVLRTRCGSVRTNPASEDGLGFYVVDAGGARRIAASTSPLNYSSSVSWDSTGAALVEEFTPICDGPHVFDRVTMSGIRSRIIGAFVAQTCLPR